MIEISEWVNVTEPVTVSPYIYNYIGVYMIICNMEGAWNIFVTDLRLEVV